MIKNKKHEGLDKNKKELLKSLMGSSTSKIDLNKIREEWKYGTN